MASTIMAAAFAGGMRQFPGTFGSSEQTLLIQKDDAFHLKPSLRTLVEMFSDPFHDTFHKCFRKPCLRHKPVSLGCIAAAQDPSSQFRIPGYQDHRCSHQLHPTVRHGGMR
ncbi:MAG: hypothetical protein IIT43_07365, partial [Clostridia bacterium]|nr:hypothetical protein [Clostridia bacterium]